MTIAIATYFASPAIIAATIYLVSYIRGDVQ